MSASLVEALLAISMFGFMTTWLCLSWGARDIYKFASLQVAVIFLFFSIMASLLGV